MIDELLEHAENEKKMNVVMKSKHEMYRSGAKKDTRNVLRQTHEAGSYPGMPNTRNGTVRFFFSNVEGSSKRAHQHRPIPVVCLE